MARFLLRRLLAALLIAVAPASAQARVALKDALLTSGVLVVETPDLKLGDLFDGLPADVAIRPLRAYDAWKTGEILTAAQLASIARDNGLSWRPPVESFEIRIERPVERIGAETIQETVVQALAAQGLPRDEFRFDPPPSPFTVEKGKVRQGLRVSNLSFDARQSRFTAEISPVAGGEIQKISGHAVAMLDVPVLSRPVGIGELIPLDAIVIQRLRADQAGRNYLLDPDRIAGKAAKRGLSAGQPIRPADLNAVMMVQKNGPITVNVVSGSMLLTMQGKALDNGSLGDTVRVLNVRSNKVLSGVVAAPAVVTVQAAMARVGSVTPAGPTN